MTQYQVPEYYKIAEDADRKARQLRAEWVRSLFRKQR